MVTATLPPAPRSSSSQVRRAAVTKSVDFLLSRSQLEPIEEVLVPIEQPDGRQQLALPVGDVGRDIRYAGNQFNALLKNNLSVLAVEVSFVESEGKENKPILVPLEIPDLESLARSYDGVGESAIRAGFRVVALSILDGMNAFRAGLVEFLDTRLLANMHSGSGGVLPVIVDSKQGGDTVLFAKGYFISTRQAFGRSTPARNHLLAGTYSFGIMIGQNPRFDPVLWSVPQLGNIWLPLP